MFTLSFGKILLVLLVIVAAWKGWRLLAAVQRKLTQADRRAPAPQATAAAPPEATDLVRCPRCGVWVPNGTWCPSVEACTLRRS
ncbi:MAG: hypothetical protein N2038_15265 [Geminicoccaceae bacterium]|nr:hypothetical protein [Geminicoccaceae bacterium]MCS7268004.1 hypothetical protein [Geminicoccaceae bacterium]MCX7631583.1 hypothetical protein [Geminicoccaceae bacterium]MDW8124082.1 hypothetical protein [Geminicoccaceae bacterium]MDW8340255.1 hypothetical protein [Geminicoccaceae bacterium]